MPYRTLAKEALDAWRSASVRLEECEPDSPQWHAASAEAEQAKQRYEDAVKAAHEAHLPEPPPFSEAIKRGDD